MSTRCQVIVTDGRDEHWFYRHSDGYPETTYKSLLKFISWLQPGGPLYERRNCVDQTAGWLIMLGNAEYGARRYPTKKGKWTAMDWKVGAYEPSEHNTHGDIEYLYTVNTMTGEITYRMCTDDWRKVYTLKDYKELLRKERAEVRARKALDK